MEGGVSVFPAAGREQRRFIQLFRAHHVILTQLPIADNCH